MVFFRVALERHRDRNGPAGRGAW